MGCSRFMRVQTSTDKKEHDFSAHYTQVCPVLGSSNKMRARGRRWWSRANCSNFGFVYAIVFLQGRYYRRYRRTGTTYSHTILSCGIGRFDL